MLIYLLVLTDLALPGGTPAEALAVKDRGSITGPDGTIVLLDWELDNCVLL